MDYSYIENLVKLSKSEDEYSKEKLAEEFRPFIINIAKKTCIHVYDFEYIINECYKILFICIVLYKTESHRFVSYATNGIKNSINDLIKRNIQTNNINGYGSTVFDNSVEETYKDDTPEITDLLCNQYDNDCLKYALKQLNSDELNLITHLFYEDKALKFYAYEKELSYSYTSKKKRYVLDKLFMHINIYINRNKNLKTSET